VTPDTSAIVAAFAPWHRFHESALSALERTTDLIAHAELEAYSVLTRLPAPFRVEPSVAADHLAKSYPGARLVLPAGERRRLVGRLAGEGVSGGRAYDALIAATAAQHDLRLITCDTRATAIYDRIGAAVRGSQRTTVKELSPNRRPTRCFERSPIPR
jgi:predicted nucleic acid-binding protein